MRQGRIDRRKLRQRTHQNPVGAQREHRGGELALQRNQDGQLSDELAKHVDHAQRSLAEATVRFDEKRQPIDPADTLQDAVKPHQIVGADRAVRRIPVRDERFAQLQFDFSHDLLRLLEKNGRAFDRRHGGRRRNSLNSSATNSSPLLQSFEFRPPLCPCTDQIQHLARRFGNIGAGTEDRRHARLFEERVILRRNDAADDDEDIIRLFFAAPRSVPARALLWPAAWLETPITCTSASTASFATSSGVWNSGPISTSKPRSAKAVAITLAPGHGRPGPSWRRESRPAALFLREASTSPRSAANTLSPS